MKFLALLATVLCTLALPLGAAVSNAKNYKGAVDKANPRRPVVLFCYGANYDRVSIRTYEEFIKKHQLQRALRTESAVILAVPIYQSPNDKERKEYNKVMGNAKLPGGIWSYPCLAIVDSKGILRGVVQSGEDMRSPEAAALALTELLKDYRAQEALLRKAEKASGGRKLRLLCDAAAFKTFMPKSLEKLDNNALIQKLDVMKPHEANAYIRNLMATHCYSRRQRQEILAAYAGHIRRKGASPKRLRAVYTEMRNIDPTSIYAIYAEGAIDIWVAPHEPKPEWEKSKPADAAKDDAKAPEDKKPAKSGSKSDSKKDSKPDPAPGPEPEPGPQPTPGPEPTPVSDAPPADPDDADDGDDADDDGFGAGEDDDEE